MLSPGPVFFVATGLPLILVAAVYARGTIARARAGRAIAPWRAGAFLGGIAAFAASVEWPFADWAHELFYVHQLGIMVARMLAPLLIAFSHPAAALIAGLPRTTRRRALAPMLSSRTVRAVWRAVAHPVSVTLGYIGAFYAWEVPAFQAAALAHPAIGYTMHLSLVATGLLFWTRIFERRPAPHAPSHGVRLMMIWLAILGQVALGAYLTIKTTILYTGYAAGEHLMGIAPLVDEQRGGALIWIPGALVSAAALIAMTRGKNRRLAIGMFAFAIGIFVMVGGATTGEHRMDRAANLKLYRESRS